MSMGHISVLALFAIYFFAVPLSLCLISAPKLVENAWFIRKVNIFPDTDEWEEYSEVLGS